MSDDYQNYWGLLRRYEELQEICKKLEEENTKLKEELRLKHSDKFYEGVMKKSWEI